MRAVSSAKTLRSRLRAVTTVPGAKSAVVSSYSQAEARIAASHAQPAICAGRPRSLRSATALFAASHPVAGLHAFGAPLRVGFGPAVRPGMTAMFPDITPELRAANPDLRGALACIDIRVF